MALIPLSCFPFFLLLAILSSPSPASSEDLALLSTPSPASSALFFTPSPASSALCHTKDKMVLLQIKSELGNPYDFISWNTPAAGACCGWYGVQCDANGRVNDLYINQISTPIKITIPASIAGLEYLTTLGFQKNPNLIGPIPPAIGQLTKLTFLRLDWNALSGPIPSFLARLTSLDYLNLSFNKFSGSIPAFLANLPLTFIRLDRNRLTGPIPESLARTTSMYLYLSHNNLTGPLPTSFASTSFQFIDLSRNRLAGDASLLLGAKKPLQNLDLSRNLFEFDLTKVVFPENLTTLYINHNKIYGSIPKQITELQGLFFLNVSYNRLCGEIPKLKLGQHDQYSFFHNKCLCGPPLAACKSQ